ncbi:MAG: cardiolipin synthase [Malacoplasma sp.]|nr:cardiolipin synthase [Malacoplasma sp.]
MDRKKIFITTLISTILMVTFFCFLVFFIYATIADEFNINYWYIIIFAVYLANNITSFYLLNNKRRIVNVRLCWIFVINFLPVIGIFSFYIFGILPFKIETSKQIKSISYNFDEHENYDFTNSFLSKNENNYSDFKFIFSYMNSPIYQNNKIKILDQSDLFEKTIKTIREAKKFIHIQFYIISDCLWFYLLLFELNKKSKEGVKIRFMYDWVGSHKRFNKSNLKFLKKNGIEIREFNPQGFNRYTSITNFRSHRKLVIVDNKYCITGGSNIGDEYLNLKKNTDNWKDLNFFIEGEIVNSLNLRFCNDWINYTGLNKKEIDNENFYKDFRIHKSNGKDICQIVNSSPEFDLYVYQQIIMSKISAAQKSIWIFTPYLLIPNEIINNLIFASYKGVDVRIMVPHHPDNKKFIITSNRSYYEKLMNADIRIYEYFGFLHSKAIIIDDDQCLIGTNNLDYRSLVINFETSISILSKDFNKKMKEIFLNDQKNSRLISLNYLHNKMDLKHRIFTYFINIIHPLL